MKSVLFSVLFALAFMALGSVGYAQDEAFSAESASAATFESNVSIVDEGLPIFNPFRPTLPTSDRLVIKIDKSLQGTSRSAQHMFVYLDGRRIYKWKVSTGREAHERTPSGESTWTHTPTGTFRIYWRNIDHVSELWDGVPMPYAQFFSGGVAIHAALPKYIPYLGHRASGGCVRLHPDHAKILWDLVTEVGTQNVLIQVYGKN